VLNVLNQEWMRKNATKLTVVTVYAFLYAIALNFFWQTAHIYAGGLTGISQIFTTIMDRWFQVSIPISVIYYMLNLPLLVIAWIKIDHKLVVYTIISVTFASLAVHFVPTVVLIKDPIICAIFGGAMNGLSLGIALKHGITTGGLDIVIIGLRKLTGKSVGVISMVINGTIVFTAGYLFGWPYAFYSLLSIFVSGKVTDLVYTKYKKVQVMIVTKNPDVVIPKIQEQLTRGMTVIRDAEGAYNHQNHAIIIAVITNHEMETLEEIINEVDPNCFVSISQDVKILGNFEEMMFL